MARRRSCMLHEGELMGEYTNKLLRQRQGKAIPTSPRSESSPKINPLYWGVEFGRMPGLFEAAQAWAEGVRVRVTTHFQHLVAKAWDPQWLNMSTTPDDIVRALVGTDMYSGGHDPSLVNGRIVAGRSFRVRERDYIVVLCGTFQRRPLSEAQDLLSKVAPDVELPIDAGGPDGLSVTVFADPRDVDTAELLASFSFHEVAVEYSEVSNNAAEATIDQLVRIVVPWTALYAFLGGLYTNKALERLGEARGQRAVSFGVRLSDALIGIARATAVWRRPVATIETVVSGCNLVFRFRKIPSGPLPGAMIADLRRAVEEASRLATYGALNGWPLRKIIYEFSIVKKVWTLSSVLRNDWRLLSGSAGASLAELINQSVSPGIEMAQAHVDANPIVLLITAVTSERSALLEVLQSEYSVTPSRQEIDGRYYNVFSWGSRGGCWDVYIGQPTEKGGPATQALLQDFVRKKHPTLVLMVGMCGGLPENGAKEGMVIMAREVFNYEPARLRDGVSKWNPTGYRCAARLLDLANALDSEHAFGDVEVKSTKDYASGDKLIDDLGSELRLKILALSGDILGFEMEAPDLLHAVWELERSKSVSVAIVKGVSDFGDGKMRDGKELRQRTATQNASRVVLKLLSEY